MVGYAIALLTKGNAVVGLRVMTLEERTFKDFTLKSAKMLYSKNREILYNIKSLTQEGLRKLPVLDVVSNKLTRDIWTVMYSAENQYLICNAKGEMYSITEDGMTQFKFTNADVLPNGILGDFVKHDTGQQQYDTWLLFNHPVQIDNGELYIKGEEMGEVLEVPSIVTSYRAGCWKEARHFSAVKLSPSAKIISQGDLEDLSTDMLVLPVGVTKLNSFAFSGCEADKVVIQGNTLAAPKIFYNAKIKEVYVNQMLLSKYRTLIETGMTLKGLGDLE